MENKYENFNNMCPYANIIMLGDILNQLDNDLSSGIPFSGEKLTEDEIEKINEMCSSIGNADIGNIMENIIEASINKSSVEELTEDEENLISNISCPVCNSQNLLEIIKDFIVKVNQNVPSSISTLSEITISEGELNPNFSSSITNYSVNVEYEVESIELNAIATNGEATISGNGEKQLNVGDNSFIIKCTAEDGSYTDYTININRQKSDDATLSSLEVEGQTLSPEFNSNVTNYNVEVLNAVDNVNIIAKANDTNASISGAGNQAVNVGANNFNIVVTAQDGTTNKTYSINITRNEVA